MAGTTVSALIVALLYAAPANAAAGVSTAAVSTSAERAHLAHIQAEAKAAADRAAALEHQADQLSTDAAKATTGMVGVAAAIQAREDKLGSLEKKLAALEAAQKGDLDKINSHRAVVTRLPSCTGLSKRRNSSIAGSISAGSAKSRAFSCGHSSRL